MISSKKNIIVKWINEAGHVQGIFWTICASFFSNLCDMSVRLIGNDLPSMQITFFRLFLGAAILFPLLLYKGKTSFFIKNKIGHFFRVIIGFGAISCWIYGASQTSLPSITTVSFTCPIFVLPLAYIFLKEKSDWKRVLSVTLGFLGVIIIAFFEKGDVGNVPKILFFHPGVVFLFLGALLFAMSDILNKKMLVSESLLSLLFYFYLGTALISFVPALLVWRPIGYNVMSSLLILGIGGVFVLYCILKAANATEISAIAPYKYVELIFSIIIGYTLFNEVINGSTFIGACLIIPSSFLIAYYEISKIKKENKNTRFVPKGASEQDLSMDEFE